MTAALYTLYILNSAFLILVVLLQSGRGGGLGEFGGATGSAVFGSSGASTLLTKLTTWSAASFMILSLVLALRSASSSITTEGEFVSTPVEELAPVIPTPSVPAEAPVNIELPVNDAPAPEAPEAP